ncbi:class I SAM-dependent methyltransferase [Pseudoroseomonas wenyumeiae]
MREWLDHTLAEIEALAPARVLEIGCGTGLLLARLAPAREAYVGTDFSQAALDGIAALRRARPELAHVHLARQMADDLAGLPEGGFDLVVINSVAQYFPSLDYLLQVLRAAATRLRPGAHLSGRSAQRRPRPGLPRFRAGRAGRAGYDAGRAGPAGARRAGRRRGAAGGAGAAVRHRPPCAGAGL